MCSEQYAVAGLGRRKRLRVVVNPAAGPGKAKATWLQQVEPIFRAAGCSTEVTCACCSLCLFLADHPQTDTERNGHCKQLAHDLKVADYDAFVVQSGDGLLYEAMNGFCTRQDAVSVLQRCPIGVIPAGAFASMSLRADA